MMVKIMSNILIPDEFKKSAKPKEIWLPHHNNIDISECNVLWKAQPKQIKFMQRYEDEALYGGAAGGGKSDALVMEATRQVHIPHYKALLIRRTFPQLKELIDKSRIMYPYAFPGCKYNESSHIWLFPSGAQIIFGSMPHNKDKYNYQGIAYDFIGFDELTHFTLDEYMYLVSRNRPNGAGTKVYMRATANPGGVGHAWVKDRFITVADPMTTIKEKVNIIGQDGQIITRTKKRIFVPATLFDNPKLLENDPNYIATLGMLPEAERNALLYGDWDSFSGQVFSEWKNIKEGYDNQRGTHVINPFPIPEHWKIYRGFDFGYAKPFSVGWYAVDEDGRIYRIREFYGCTGEPNVGVKYDPHKMAQMIKDIEDNDPMLKGKKIYGIADPSIYDESRGQSVGMMMERHGIYFNPGDNTRIAGKMQFHYRLAFDDGGRPMFYVFKTCKHFIRTIPSLVYSETDVEDIDTRLEDHIYDECLSGDTLVITDNGSIPIKNLVGTTGKVYSHDGQLHNYSDCRLTKKQADVYIVELEDGTKIKATSNHPFMLDNGEFVELKDLYEGRNVKTISVP